MLHIATVHWKDDRWVDIQLAYLRRHISGEFKVYAFLHGLPDRHRSKYFYSSIEPIRSHAIKLNLLADMAAFNATSADDWLMFLDGDAFPVGEVVPYGETMFERFPLMAVQRRENNGDLQPHPCFCLTTVGFWKSIGGDWKEGHQWMNLQGELVSDVGGNLLGILERREMSWHPMRRTNRKNLHPLLFGIYDDLVYHHGLGFRTGPTRIGLLGESRKNPFYGVIERASGLLPARGTFGRIRRSISPERRARDNAAARNEQLSHAVFESIQRDPLFYRDFQTA